MNATQEKPTYQTVSEFAEDLQVHRNTVFNWIRQGDIPVLRIRNTTRINREAALKALESRNEARAVAA